MGKEIKQGLSLTSKDIECVINRKKYRIMKRIIDIISIVGLIVATPVVILGLLLSIAQEMLGVIIVVGVSLLVAAVVTVRENLCSLIDNGDEVLERIKLIVKQECPEKTLDGRNFSIVKGNTINNLKKVGKGLELFSKKPSVGTRATQYVLSTSKVSDEANIESDLLGAIEETVTGRLEHIPTEFDYTAKQVFDFNFKWVPASEVRPYDDKPNRPKIRIK